MDHAAKLAEAQKVSDTHLQNTKQDVGMLQDRVNTLQVDMETKMAKDTAALKEALAQANAAIGTLRGYADASKVEQQEQREALRVTNTGLQGLNDELAKANTNSHMLEQRLAEATGNLKTTQQGLAETNAVALKIHEDHKNTKSQLQATQDNLKKTSSAVKRAHDGLDAATTKLGNTFDQLQKTVGGLDQTKAQLERTAHQVRSLDHAHGVLNGTTNQLRAHLEDTSATVNAVKAGLKETNSIVLPNLQMDSNRPWSLMSTDRVLKPLASPNRTKKGGATPRMGMGEDDPFMS